MRCGGWTPGQKLSSRIGSGCEVTSNANRRPGSHTVMGSTNGPVENSQYRIAPTPVPSIRACFGYAMPDRNHHSVGSASGGKAITCGHTSSGEAAISIEDRTSCNGGSGRTAPSIPQPAGTSMNPIIRLVQPRPALPSAVPTDVPITARGMASGSDITRHPRPSIATSSMPAADILNATTSASTRS